MFKNLSLMLIIMVLVGCVNDSKTTNKSYDSVKLTRETKKENIEKPDFDSTYVMRIMGKDSFNLVRKNYKLNIISLLSRLDSDKNLKTSLDTYDFQNLNNKILASKIDYKSILNSIPISPAEFKIYDLFFYDTKYENQINNLERIIFLICNKSKDDFQYKLDFCIAYTNMFSFMYSGIVKKPERLLDGYYYYELNTLICSNINLFCNKVWKRLNPLANQVDVNGNDTYSLYNCRCNEKNVDEFKFCK